MAQTLGGEVQHATMREFGKTEIDVNTTSPLFKRPAGKEVVWMSHQDYVASIPEGFEISPYGKLPRRSHAESAKNSTPCSIIRKYSIRNTARNDP